VGLCAQGKAVVSRDRTLLTIGKNNNTANQSWGDLQDAEVLLRDLYEAAEDWDRAVIDFLK
jgi:hypothetical protein